LPCDEAVLSALSVASSEEGGSPSGNLPIGQAR